MLKKMMQWTLVAVFCAGVSVNVYGQSATDGAIGGTVVDSSGSAVPNATVVVRSNTTNAEQTVMTDSSGFFRLVHLPASSFTVSISASGFQKYESKDVTV